MKGYYPVEIPTKKHIKTYILSQLGLQSLMNINTVIGAKLYDVPALQTNKAVIK